MKNRLASEKNMELRFQKDMHSLGGFTHKVAHGINGYPDRLGIAPNGYMFFVEFKSEGDGPSKLQKVWHKRLRRLGQDVFVVASEEHYRAMWQHVRNRVQDNVF